MREGVVAGVVKGWWGVVGKGVLRMGLAFFFLDGLITD